MLVTRRFCAGVVESSVNAVYPLFYLFIYDKSMIVNIRYSIVNYNLHPIG